MRHNCSTAPPAEVGARAGYRCPFMELGGTDESPDVGDVGLSRALARECETLARNKPISRNVRECMSPLLEGCSGWAPFEHDPRFARDRRRVFLTFAAVY